MPYAEYPKKSSKHVSCNQVISVADFALPRRDSAFMPLLQERQVRENYHVHDTVFLL